MNQRGFGRGRGRPLNSSRRGRAPPFTLGLKQQPRTMGSGSNKIARSPTPPETDDDGEEWPVHGIVGEDVDVFGISRYDVHTTSPSTHYSSSTLFAQLRGKPRHHTHTFMLIYDYQRSDGKTGVVRTAATQLGCATLKATRLSSSVGTKR